MTAERVPILDGEHWVVFQSPESVTNRQRRPYSRVFMQVYELVKADTTQRSNGVKFAEALASDPDLAEEYALAVAFMYVVEWSFDVPVIVDWDLFRLWMDEQPNGMFDAVTINALAHQRKVEKIAAPVGKASAAKRPRKKAKA
jgi:hypothetical protein